VPGADGKIRSVIQHHLDAASYAFAGSAPGAMRKLFEDRSRPLLEQAVAEHLAPLPLDAVADYVEARFQATGRHIGRALDPFVSFTRGHPQRCMMLAHYLWRRTRPGRAADEQVWLDALEAALGDSSALMRAIWRSLPLNERRLALALAALDSSLYSEETAAAVGIKRNTVGSALAGLRDGADVIQERGGEPRLTDPLFELWLERRGLAPPGEDDSAES
jgi:hypothetical protein